MTNNFLMEVVVGVYSDGTIIEIDIISGQVKRQVKTFQGQFNTGPYLVTNCSSTGNPDSPDNSLIIQNKNSAKASLWSCFDV